MTDSAPAPVDGSKPRHSVQPTDLTGVFRYYFDASTWNWVCDHPESDALIRSIRRKGRCAVIPSIVNAVELLNTRNAARRRALCKTMNDLLDDNHTLLGHPEETVKLAAAELLAGKQSITVYEDSYALAFREWLADPDTLDSEGRDLLKRWDVTLRDIVEGPWKETPAVAVEPEFKIDLSLLMSDVFVPVLQERMERRRLAVSESDVRRLIQETGVWTGYAVCMAHVYFRGLDSAYSKTKSRALPNAPDLFQLPYMGLVNLFVTADEGLLKAARGVEQMVAPLRPSASRWAMSAQEFFTRRGFPLA